MLSKDLQGFGVTGRASGTGFGHFRHTWEKFEPVAKVPGKEYCTTRPDMPVWINGPGRPVRCVEKHSRICVGEPWASTCF